MEESQIIKYLTEKRYIEDIYVCWDFVIDVYADLYGIELPEYPVDEVQTEFKNKLVSNFEHTLVKKGWEKEGDIVVFSLFANQHAGVMINCNSFIHLSTEGVQVSDLKNLLGNYKIYRVLK